MSSPKPPDDRRRNITLRELLDDLIVHVRDLARRAPAMTQSELDYAQERLEWLADEIWTSASKGERKS